MDPSFWWYMVFTPKNIFSDLQNGVSVATFVDTVVLADGRTFLLDTFFFLGEGGGERGRGRRGTCVLINCS